jgi:hypothetical protein
MHRILVLVALILIPNISLAHPGNTAADGCHYCRTNCDKWGEAWGERHCHGGYTAPSTYSPPKTYTPPKPRCPANSTLIGDTCVCKEGYGAFRSSCIKIPANAHAVTSTTDAWECDYGYIEKGTGCTPKPVPVSSLSSSARASSKSSSSIAALPPSSAAPVINQSIDLSPPASNPPASSGGFWNRVWLLFFRS